jgi:hypothetical protein
MKEAKVILFTAVGVIGLISMSMHFRKLPTVDEKRAHLQAVVDKQLPRGTRLQSIREWADEHEFTLTAALNKRAIEVDLGTFRYRTKDDCGLGVFTAVISLDEGGRSLSQAVEDRSACVSQIKMDPAG